MSYLALAQEPVVFWRVLRLKLGSSAGGDSLRFLVDFLKPIHVKYKSEFFLSYHKLKITQSFRSKVHCIVYGLSSTRLGFCHSLPLLTQSILARLIWYLAYPVRINPTWAQL